MQVGKLISIIIASTIKFIGGPLTGAALGVPWVQTALGTALGMMLSVFVVTFAGNAIQAVIDRYRSRKPRRFTTRSRRAVRIWKRFGMAGIAFLTPLILTPIGGTAIAVSFRVGRLRLLSHMLVSAVFWAILQTLLLYQIPGLLGFFSHR
jgi:hypothetical protein